MLPPGNQSHLGDRYAITQLLFGAQIFVPSVAKGMSLTDAKPLLAQLRHYPVLNKDSVIDGLLDGWAAYQYYLAKEPVKKDEDVLKWHYDHRKGRPCPTPLPACRYCKCSTKCKCMAGLQMWWEVASLLALVQPSSAAAERVFSVLKAFWSHLQTNSLADAIRMSLFLACNKRL